MKQKKAFTLIELLVVMAVISMIIAIALPNYLGIRQRARDSKKKSELVEIKNALRMYYGDFQRYPQKLNGNDSRKFDGCGVNGTSNCPSGGTCTADFSQGGADGCSVVYMKKFTDYAPSDAVGYGWTYGSVAPYEDFCLYIQLDNTGDTDIATSRAKCATVCAASAGGYAGAANYVVCAD